MSEQPDLGPGTAPDTLVVGAGGLLGGAVVRELFGQRRSTRSVTVPWQERSGAVSALAEAAEDLLASGRPWRIVWCAGAGVIGTTQAEFDLELAVLTDFLARLEVLVAGAGASGSVFLASSAGGAYAGSTGLPFTEDTEPRANSPYGVAKLATEDALRDFAGRSGVPVVIGRISNLYGPGQDLRKPQGLVSQLCRAQLQRQPLSIYVSLDTGRDYLYVDDAARLAIAAVDRAAGERVGSVTVKILASHRVTTIAAVLGELRRITKQAPRVVLGASPTAKFQIRDLRFRSVVWPDLDALVTTTLPSGVFTTMEGVAFDLRAGRR